jgi:hypothetical protein
VIGGLQTEDALELVHHPGHARSAGDDDVLDDLVFAGGCATGLVMTDLAAESVRPTTDVDRSISGESRSQAETRGFRVTGIDQLGASGRGIGCIQAMGVNGCNIGSCSDPTLSISPRKS